MNINNKLVQIGLTEKQARVYSALLENGLSPARYIIFKAELKRGITYEVLDQLIKLNLVEKVENHGKIALFRTTHPNNLETFFEKKKKEIKDTEEFLKNEMGEFLSMYNLLSGKPNVRFFEGDEAIEKITNDYPTKDIEIRQFINISEALKYINKETMHYKNERIKKGISKRMIVNHSIANNEYINKVENQNLTQYKTINQELPTAIQVYDDKIAMLNLNPNHQIGYIIEDQMMSDTLKNIFDELWNKQ